ncbi:PAAR domain-containing protein [Dyella acidiphila]|uniref:PAAR domain-containing protein n=1 Tax=Dyella acidiphila TaxID=2775866 RepID=A0ABR9GDT3_9GAMM|nr:PAAR domain-containing protein [Dyella acidiphila]MBE1162187.1 PAAR domain-containing protein [Dyella acidiphila]
MALLRSGGPIRLGDALVHGGRVIYVRQTTHPIYGKGIAHRGDMAQCQRHDGVFPFVEGCYGRSSYGSGIVLEGHRLACGCFAVSSCASTFTISDWFPSELGAALARAHAEGPVPGSASRWIPPPMPAGYFFPEETQAHPLVTLRIGLFFDGTGNNADNAAMGEHCRITPKSEAEARALLACKPYMTTGSPEGHAISRAGSYGNGVSNIGRLFGLYQDSAEASGHPKFGETYVTPIYVPGVGTRAGEKDSSLDMITGAGSTGIFARVEEALTEQAHRTLQNFAHQHEDAWITDIIFDVFGFSRGAAAARHAINQINLKEHGPLSRAIAVSKLKLAPGFDWGAHIRVGFAGLFDTVAHVGNVKGDPQSLALWAGIDICLRKDCADAVVHLTARDEHRLNFPLTSVAPPWKDIPLPGVHADLGGGYRDDDGIEDVLLSRPVISQEFKWTPLEKTQAFKEVSKQLAAIRQDYSALANEIDICTWIVATSTKDPSSDGRPQLSTNWFMERFTGPIQSVGAAVRLRHKVSNNYALAALRIMHAMATDKGVPFDPIPHATQYKIRDELLPIAEKMLIHARGENHDFSPEQERILQTSYLHHSANWNMLRPDDGEPLALYYIDRPAEKGERVIFPNLDDPS